MNTIRIWQQAVKKEKATMIYRQSELQEPVRQQGRLPGIPSWAEIQVSGGLHR